VPSSPTVPGVRTIRMPGTAPAGGSTVSARAAGGGTPGGVSPRGLAMCLVYPVTPVGSRSLAARLPSTLLAKMYRDGGLGKGVYVLAACLPTLPCAERDSMSVLQAYLRQCGSLTPAVGAVRLGRETSKQPGSLRRTSTATSAATTAGRSVRTAMAKPAPT
jgi:hypothetical protein